MATDETGAYRVRVDRSGRGASIRMLTAPDEETSAERWLETRESPTKAYHAKWSMTTSAT